MRDIIKPTIGRVVHYYTNSSGRDVVQHDDTEPMAAIITYVWSDDMVNLAVFDHNGNAHSMTSITLRQPDRPVPMYEHCAWMPYQIGQAKKTEELAAALREGRLGHGVNGSIGTDFAQGQDDPEEQERVA